MISQRKLAFLHGWAVRRRLRASILRGFPDSRCGPMRRFRSSLRRRERQRADGRANERLRRIRLGRRRSSRRRFPRPRSGSLLLQPRPFAAGLSHPTGRCTTGRCRGSAASRSGQVFCRWRSCPAAPIGGDARAGSSPWAVVIAVSFADDWCGVRPSVRLAVHALAALAVVASSAVARRSAEGISRAACSRRRRRRARDRLVGESVQFHGRQRRARGGDVDLRFRRLRRGRRCAPG